MRPRVLVVDDDPHVGELLGLYAAREGLTVETVLDGDAALEAVRRQAPDLIILDLNLPAVDGLEVCRALRSGIGQWIPIIMLTARDEEADRVVGLELGADDYVTKPFSPREVVARIKAVLRRAGMPPVDHGDSVQVPAAALEIRPQGRRVWVGGEEVALAPREYDLLLCLASHPGRVFTRSMLLDQVWGYDYFGDPRTVDVHIRRLRRKLPEPAASCIETVWGVGYRFEVPAS
ncbi:MAG TPA: response regulator transcription factor [Bacillota bacterium]